jgi:hypothetical protein
MGILRNVGCWRKLNIPPFDSFQRFLTFHCTPGSIARSAGIARLGEKSTPCPVSGNIFWGNRAAGGPISSKSPRKGSFFKTLSAKVRNDDASL